MRNIVQKYFKKIDTTPTPAFRANLRKQILEASPKQSRFQVMLPTLRLAAVGMIAIVFVAISSLSSFTQSPQDALAKAIQNTFIFSEKGYRYQKTELRQNMPNSIEVTFHTSEYWQDDTRAMSKFTIQGTLHGGNIVDQISGDYFDSNDQTLCAFSTPQEEPNCDFSSYGREYSVELNNDESLSFNSLTIEPADEDDRYGDFYLTWKTNQELDKTVTIFSEAGPYAYAGNIFNGTYGWKDGDEFVNRITLHDPTANNIDKDNKEFLIKIAELSTDPSSGKVDFSRASNVYLVNVEALTITPVSDNWLSDSRELFKKVYKEYAIETNTSVESMREQYQQTFQAALQILDNPEAYSLIEREIWSRNGQTLETQKYNFGGLSINGVDINTIEFTFNPDTSLIQEVIRYTEHGEISSQTTLITIEERPTAPEGIFTLESWTEKLGL